MTTPKPPRKQIQLQPGESPWAAMARELARNPDSPASLKIMSAVSRSMAPRQRANDQLVEALDAQLRRPGEQQNAAVSAAIQYWEREFGEPMSSDTLVDLTREVTARIQRGRRGPPAMESILGNLPVATDTGYDHGIHLEGMKGTWHRLWALIALVHGFNDDPSSDEGVSAIRGQFQDILGRPMTTEEWDALVAHAVQHADRTR